MAKLELHLAGADAQFSTNWYLDDTPKNVKRMQKQARLAVETNSAVFYARVVRFNGGEPVTIAEYSKAVARG